MKKRSPSIIPANYSNSFNKFVYDEINADSLVLDVGCWNGNLGKKIIQDKNCIAHGIDFDKSILQEAKKNKYSETFLIDMNKNPDKITSIKHRYDVIVCADIIEHLIDPNNILILLKSLLKKSGKIIISVPNVAFGLNRLNLLLGRWDYTEFGTLDKTHIRFFTSKTLKNLVNSSGYSMIKFRPYNQFGILAKLHPFDQLIPNILCYQLLITAKKSNNL